MGLSITGVFRLTIVSSLGGCFGGCFFSKTSWTLSEGALHGIDYSVYMQWSACVIVGNQSQRRPPLPSIISFENFLEIWSVGAFRLLPSLEKQLWIVCPSSNRLSRFPSFHWPRRHSKCFTCSFVRDRDCDF